MTSSKDRQESIPRTIDADDERELLKWVRFGIDTEEKGIKFYGLCQKEIRNPRAIEFFEFLVRIETGHKNILTDLLNATAKGDEALVKRSVADFLALPVKNPLFTKDAQDKILRKDTTVQEMINTAIKMEEQGIDLYSKLAKGVDNAKLKALFTRLSNDENDHKRELINMGFYIFGMPIPYGEGTPPDD